jgi:hypothetical protein
MMNAFADENENPELPGSDWDFSFSEKDGTTTVSIVIKNESRERMEKMIEMGFKQGFFDLADCDKVLRVEGDNMEALSIMMLVKEHGFTCELLD